MKKFVLTFALSLIFIAFVIYLYNAYLLQNNYFLSKLKTSEVETPENSETQESKSLYEDYSKSVYDQALYENRLIVLFFTSNWCNDCLSQDKINKDIFSSLYNKGVVGLRIHILDSETTTETDAIAKKFEVSKENTFVILDKRGAVGLKHVGLMTNEQLTSSIEKVGDIK